MQQNRSNRNLPPRYTGPRCNLNITSKNIRLVGTKEHDGVHNLSTALAVARSYDLDLIEIKIENNDTSICRIEALDKYLYQQKQKLKEQKKNSHATEMKEIRLSPDISDNDIAYRVKNALAWFKEGHKVKCTLTFKGRQILFKDKGEMQMLKFASLVEEAGQLEAMPKLDGKRMFCIFKPKSK